MSDLLSLTDTLTWEAYQNEGKVDLTLEAVYERAGQIIFDVTESHPPPSQDQLRQLTDRLDQLSIRLRDRGDKHISDLNKKEYKISLKIKGGTGYTRRFLEEDWSILDTSYKSLHPIPELKDRVLTLRDTSKAL